MTLEDYLWKNKLKPKYFSELAEVPLASIYRAIKGIPISDLERAKKISAATNNEVTIEELMRK